MEFKDKYYYKCLNLSCKYYNWLVSYPKGEPEGSLSCSCNEYYIDKYIIKNKKEEDNE